MRSGRVRGRPQLVALVEAAPQKLAAGRRIVVAGLLVGAGFGDGKLNFRRAITSKRYIAVRYATNEFDVRMLSWAWIDSPFSSNDDLRSVGIPPPRKMATFEGGAFGRNQCLRMDQDKVTNRNPKTI